MENRFGISIESFGGFLDLPLIQISALTDPATAVKLTENPQNLGLSIEKTDENDVPGA